MQTQNEENSQDLPSPTNKYELKKMKLTETAKKKHDLEQFEMELLQFLDHQLKSYLSKGLYSLSIAISLKLCQAIIESDP